MFKQGMISVIVPVYNVEEYLPRCLDSILKGSFINLEIICINDGSTDKSLTILRKYSEIDNRIIVINQSNQGLSSARNKGLDHATGEYIAFVDSDDWVHEQYFKYLYDAAKTVDADIAICDHVRTSDSSALNQKAEYHTAPMTLDQLFEKHDKKSYVWERLYKHQLIEDLRFDRQQKLEDIMFNMNVLRSKENVTIVYVNAVLYGYYVRTDSLVNKISENNILDLSEKFLYLSLNDQTSEALKEHLAEEAIKLSLSSRYTFLILEDRINTKRAKTVIRSSLKLMKKSKTKYRILYFFPSIYRAFRIMNDKTMLIYEKQLKERKQ